MSKKLFSPSLPNKGSAFYLIRVGRQAVVVISVENVGDDVEVDPLDGVAERVEAEQGEHQPPAPEHGHCARLGGLALPASLAALGRCHDIAAIFRLGDVHFGVLRLGGWF